MSKKKSDSDIYAYIYKNKPFKNSSADCSNLLKGLYESLSGTINNDKVLIASGENKVMTSSSKLTKDVSGEIIKYIFHTIDNTIKPSKKRKRRKNDEPTRQSGPRTEDQHPSS